jgi:hypothetical protein
MRTPEPQPTKSPVMRTSSAAWACGHTNSTSVEEEREAPDRESTAMEGVDTAAEGEEEVWDMMVVYIRQCEEMGRKRCLSLLTKYPKVAVYIESLQRLWSGRKCLRKHPLRGLVLRKNLRPATSEGFAGGYRKLLGDFPKTRTGLSNAGESKNHIYQINDKPSNLSPRKSLPPLQLFNPIYQDARTTTAI